MEPSVGESESRRREGALGWVPSQISAYFSRSEGGREEAAHCES